MKVTSVYQIALKDIDQYNILIYGNEQSRYVIGRRELWTKEVRRMNRALGIHNINYGKVGKKNKNYYQKITVKNR